MEDEKIIQIISAGEYSIILIALTNHGNLFERGCKGWQEIELPRMLKRVTAK